MRSIDTARNTLAIMEHDGAKPSFHELSKALDAIEAELADHYVELPVDADGEHIHIGDKVTEHEDGHTFKVDGFMDWGGEWWVFMRDGIQAPARMCTHYHAPTVEDVLRELVADYMNTPLDDSNEDEFFAEYAKRLRLAGEDE